MAVYAITKYPRQCDLRDGSSVTLRPMTEKDGEALLAFFRRIPEDERFLLKDDVTSPKVIESWTAHLDYDRALPLLAVTDGRVVANAVLIRHRAGCKRHLGEIRVVIDPEFRSRGLGVMIMRELVEIAWDAELEQAEFEMVTGVQDEAIKAAEVLGAFPAGTITDAVRDCDGGLHDVVVLRLPLGKWWQWSQF